MSKKPEEILIEERKRKGYTQSSMAEELAKTLNQTYSSRQYSKLEDGEFPKYKKDVLVAVDKILGTKLTELVYEQNVQQGSAENKPLSAEDAIKKGHLERALDNLAEDKLRTTALMERMMTMLENKYATKFDPSLEIPGDPGTETGGNKKANQKKAG